MDIEKEELQKRIIELENENEKLKRQLAEYEKAFEKLEKENDKLTDTIGELKEEIFGLKSFYNLPLSFKFGKKA